MSRSKKRRYTKEGSQSNTETKEPNTSKSVEEESSKTDSAQTSKTNDPSWYEKDMQLVIDSSSIPFSEPLGSRLHLDCNDAEGVVSAHVIVGNTPETDESVPGIMTFEAYPAYGDAKDRLSPINVAATALYSHVRYVNNGRKNYDPADLFLMVASVAELYSFINWCRRIYGVAFAYSQSNFYIGKALLEAQHIRPESILNNLANFRYWINTFTNKISSYAAPASIALFYRRAYQYSSVYKEHDSDSIKDQMYLYNPKGFYRFALDASGKGMLEMVDTSRHMRELSGVRFMDMENIMEIGEELLANIWADEDFGLMSGDIAKAFQGDILKLESLPEEFVIVPVHDPNVLVQMENTSITPAQETLAVSNGMENVEVKYRVGSDEVNYEWRNVYQDVNGNLFSHWAVSSDLLSADQKQLNGGSSTLPLLFDKVLAVHTASPDPSIVIEAVQNTVNAINGKRHDDFCKPWVVDDEDVHEVPEEDIKDIYLIEPGATVVSSIISWEYAPKSEDLFLPWRRLSENRVVPAIRTEAPLNNLVTPYRWMKVLNFKYCPHLYTYTVGNAEGHGTIDRLVVLSNLDVYAIVDRDQLHRMLEVSLLSLLFVPGVAKYVNSSVSN